MTDILQPIKDPRYSNLAIHPLVALMQFAKSKMELVLALA